MLSLLHVSLVLPFLSLVLVLPFLSLSCCLSFASRASFLSFASRASFLSIASRSCFLSSLSLSFSSRSLCLSSLARFCCFTANSWSSLPVRSKDLPKSSNARKVVGSLSSPDAILLTSQLPKIKIEQTSFPVAMFFKKCDCLLKSPLRKWHGSQNATAQISFQVNANGTVAKMRLPFSNKCLANLTGTVAKMRPTTGTVAKNVPNNSNSPNLQRGEWNLLKKKRFIYSSNLGVWKWVHLKNNMCTWRKNTMQVSATPWSISKKLKDEGIASTVFIKMATDWQVSEVGDTCRPAAGPGSRRSVQIEWISAWSAHLGFPVLLRCSPLACARNYDE